jgi:FkbM family methyltransferase
MVNFSGINNKTLLGKILRAPLRLIPPDTKMRILQGRLRGKKWIVGSGYHGCWLGSYEHDKRVAFERFVRDGDVVYDIGAHVGFYTLLASSLCGHSGVVVAIEPLPRNLNYLRSHLRINHVTNVRVIEAAVSDTAQDALFFEAPESSMGYLSDSGKIHVKTITLDGLVASGEIPAPTHMKIDVEGAEFKVLLGSRFVLAAYHPTIFLATHGSDVHRRCCEILRTFGYTLSPLSGTTLDQANEILACGEDTKAAVPALPERG